MEQLGLKPLKYIQQIAMKTYVLFSYLHILIWYTQPKLTVPKVG